MRRVIAITALLATAVALATPDRASACGGFFCGQQPVDQQAERVVFAVNEDAGTVDMIVQISYRGAADDFAWVVPLDAVPVEGSLDTFPQLALTSLDANTGVVINPPWDCFAFEDAATGGAPPPMAGGDGGVTVHIREEVGPYDVAVVESEDPSALVTWLRDNGFRVTTPMEPYIERYTDAGMKFLALKLLNDAGVEDIAPFKMTLPGQAPTLPLQMTALAAEPEMGILVMILGSQRYEPANWPDLDIDLAEVVFDYNTWTHNWTTVVAKNVDAAGGQGWVTEMAGSTTPLLDRATAVPPADAEQEAAVEALVGLLSAHPYFSRLYTRLSAEEMTSDPMFRRSEAGDVDRFRTLPTMPDATCDWTMPPEASDGCDFVACGAGGLCAIAMVDGAEVAGCACVPGATARTTFDAEGDVTVACQDQRMSFLNPGDRETPDATPLPDPCAGYACGAGRCVPMNMTPTCECDAGFVAVGSLGAAGERITRCVAPIEALPSDFYEIRLPDRPLGLPAGRDVLVPPPTTTTAYGSGGGGCAVGGGAGGAGSGLAGLALLGLALGVVRRRRRAA